MLGLFLYNSLFLFFIAAEPTVRTELMEQIPPIAIFLQENRSNFPLMFSEYLIPIVVRYLTDPNNQVWKSATLRSLEQVLFSLISADIHHSESSILELSDSRTKGLFVPVPLVMWQDRQHSFLLSWDISFFFLSFCYGKFQTHVTVERILK